MQNNKMNVITGNDNITNAVRKIIEQYIQNNPDANKTQIMRGTGFSYPTVLKHLKEIKDNSLISHIKKEQERLGIILNGWEKAWPDAGNAMIEYKNVQYIVQIKSREGITPTPTHFALDARKLIGKTKIASFLYHSIESVLLHIIYEQGVNKKRTKVLPN